MDIETFQQLPVTEIARLVRAAGPKVCGFPANGTRRWFVLEHPELASERGVDAYLQVAGQRHLEVWQLFFEHGVDTLLAPVFGSAVAARDEAYQPLIIPGLLWFTTSPQALDFYDKHEVHVSVYGSARRRLTDPAYAKVLASFEAIAQRTVHHRRHRLLIGVYAEDSTEAVAEIAVRLHQTQGHLPSKHQIIEAYYDGYVEPLSFFIGFEPMAMFDVPLVASGMEDLYFTVSPSLYLDDYTLRAILYDHLYARRTTDAYGRLTTDDWQQLGNFYRLNQRHVLGVGRQSARGCWWHPVPQVELPPE
jgi:tuberculosinol/isotuberculosinol synthase